MTKGLITIKTFVLRSIRNRTRLFASLLIVSIIFKLSVVTVPLILGKIVDSLVTTDFNFRLIGLLIGGFVLVNLISLVLSPVQSYFLNNFTQKTIMEASAYWCGKVLKKDFPFFNSLHVGEILKLTERGIVAHEKLLNFVVMVTFPLIVEFLIVTGALFWVGNIHIIIIVLVASAFNLVATYHIVEWRRKHIDVVNSAEDDVSSKLADVINNGSAIKIEQKEGNVVSGLTTKFAEYARATVQVSISGSILTSFQGLAIMLATSSILSYGAWAVHNGVLSVGDLVAIFSLSGSFMLTINGFSKGYRFLDQFIVDTKHFSRLLSLDEFDRDGKSISEFSELRLFPAKHVVNENFILDVNNTISIRKKERIVIIGTTGSGKSLLLCALSGLEPKCRKDVTVNNVKLTDLSSDSHLSLFRVSDQNPRIMSGSINDAVYFGAFPDSAQYSDLLQQLGLPPDVVSGERFIEENAENLSGGEAKRLSLSRVLLNPGEVNFLDEPTTSVDDATSTDVWNLIFEKLAGKTIVCTTHDLNALKRFDRILIVLNGQIVEDGSPDQVLFSEAYNKVRQVLI